MSNAKHERLSSQVRQICSRARETKMPFADVLPPQQVQQAIDQHGPRVRKCFFSPLLTLYAFLAQVIHADGSCRQALAQLLAGLGAQGQEADCSDTGPYCKARSRLPESLPAQLARDSGQCLQHRVDAGELLQGRPIKIIDGTTCSMPDTPANQAEYPQPRTQKPGLGFPILRMVVILSLHCGVVLDAAMGRWRGKQASEVALLRTMLHQFQAGDVALGDRYFCSYWLMALFQQQGVDCLFRMHQLRKIDFRKGQRLGRQDHVVRWKKPSRPEWMQQVMYDTLPEELEIRELKYHLHVKGFRVKVLVLATTLREASSYPAEELARAFRARWHAELDLRSIKAAMGMDVLRCKTPAMVRKEIWMHLLAYNLIRTVMAQAAQEQGRMPREISFTGAMQLLRSFAPAMALVPPSVVTAMHQLLLETLGQQIVGDRPDRYEPRAVKRRRKCQSVLMEPRKKAKRRLARY